jgi:hypothetical protein
MEKKWTNNAIIKNATPHNNFGAITNLTFVREKNAVFSSRHHEMLMETSLIQCLLVLMKQLDFVESNFEPVKYQQDLFYADPHLFLCPTFPFSLNLVYASF